MKSILLLINKEFKLWQHYIKKEGGGILIMY